MVGRMHTGLAHSRIEAKVAHQLLRGAEASDVADSGDKTSGDVDIHAVDRQQTLDLLVAKYRLTKLLLDGFKVLPEAVELSQSLFDSKAFIQRQWLLGEPCTPSLSKHIGRRTALDQVRRQDSMDLIFESCALPHDLSSPGDLPAQSLCAFVRHPYLRQEAAREQLRKDRRVDLVGLDPRLGDQPHLQRVRDHDAPYMRLERRCDRRGVGRGLENHIICRPKTPGVFVKCLVVQLDATACAQNPVLKIRDFSERPADVQSDYTHGYSPWVGANHTPREPMGDTTTTDPRSKRNRASRRGGQLTTRARGSSFGTAYPPSWLPGAPVPDGRTIRRVGRDAKAPPLSCRLTIPSSASSVRSDAARASSAPFRMDTAR